MKSLVMIAAVVLICQAAKVPQKVAHQVTVPVPSEFLAEPPPPILASSLRNHPKSDTPAQVVEVAKDHVLLTTVQPETKSLTATINERQREMADKTSALVPATDNESVKPHMAMVAHKIVSLRSMRSNKIETKTAQPITMSPATVTENPVVKSADLSTIDPCDLLCTKFEFDPICAFNGLCLHEFPNQCILETYNCKHSKGKFTATKDDRCQMGWLTKCEESEMI